MTNQTVQQLIVVSQAAVNTKQLTGQIALFNANGTPKTIATPATAQVDSVAATVAALVTDFNALLAKLRAAGVMLP